MTAQYKTDEASVSEALGVLLKKLEGVSLNDIEAINDATWHTAAQFDVDQTALEDALAASGWPGARANSGQGLAAIGTLLVNGMVVFEPSGRGKSFSLPNLTAEFFKEPNARNEAVLSSTQDGMSCLFGGKKEAS